MVVITDDIEIDESELDVKFVRSGGPGGQHVNKVATAVQLRFDARSSPSLPERVFERLRRVAGSRMTDEGIVVIESNRFRSQKRNREDAIERLVALLKRAAEEPKKRRPTKPSAQAKERRLGDKRRRSAIKEQRRPVQSED